MIWRASLVPLETHNAAQADMSWLVRRQYSLRPSKSPSADWLPQRRLISKG